ncbi:hypothetical protein O3G_MSEX011797 [Manduca sexta]|uniref:Serpin domain-containing protein n=1 Tax=Manduca sexta TaxID=7130 RepID=A0A922CUP3_MANSE|nr:hypothetical protein O3G_MSEX011797 [Manduca sexta]
MMNDSNIDLTFRAFTDEHLSKEFTQNFKNIFKGDVEYIDFSDVCEATSDINSWFKKQFEGPSTNVIDSDYLRKRNGGIIFGNYLYTRTSFDHPFNPKGLTHILFRKNEHEVQNMVALTGVGFVRYAELPELKANMLMVPLVGEQNVVVWLYPTNTDDMMDMIYQIQDPNKLHAAFSKLKAACRNLHATIGQAHVVNRYSTFIPELNLDLSGLKGVHKDNKTPSGYSILQQLHLIADKFIRGGMYITFYPQQ